MLLAFGVCVTEEKAAACWLLLFCGQRNKELGFAKCMDVRTRAKPSWAPAAAGVRWLCLFLAGSAVLGQKRAGINAHFHFSNL